MVKTLYLIAGANGSGKTTLAKELLAVEKDLFFLNADEIAKSIKDDFGIESGKILLGNFDQHLKNKESIVMETTLSGNYQMRVIEKCKKLKYKFILIYVFLDSVEQNIIRVKQRVALGGHNVPEEFIRRRHSRSLANFWKIIDMADDWKLYYNGETSYEMIAKNSIEDVEILNVDVYNKFKKGLK